MGAAAAPILLANAPSIAARKPAPPGLWGAAISAHQSEGNNVNSNAWLAENITPTMFNERSGDACDSYHRYDEDFAIAQGLGLNCYRLGIEWARFVFDEQGLVPPPVGAELTTSGYEYYPEALAVADDARRIAFIDAALDGVRACLDEGIAVHSYIYWSLLDNFEWTAGYHATFGLCSVDRESFKRALRPSARHFGAIASANRLSAAGKKKGAHGRPFSLFCRSRDQKRCWRS